MKKIQEKKEYKIIKVIEFNLLHKENYERVALALALSGYFVRIKNSEDGTSKVVEVYSF